MLTTCKDWRRTRMHTYFIKKRKDWEKCKTKRSEEKSSKEWYGLHTHSHPFRLCCWHSPCKHIHSLRRHPSALDTNRRNQQILILNRKIYTYIYICMFLTISILCGMEGASCVLQAQPRSSTLHTADANRSTTMRICNFNTFARAKDVYERSWHLHSMRYCDNARTKIENRNDPRGLRATTYQFYTYRILKYLQERLSSR